MNHDAQELGKKMFVNVMLGRSCDNCKYGNCPYDRDISEGIPEIDGVYICHKWSDDYF